MHRIKLLLCLFIFSSTCARAEFDDLVSASLDGVSTSNQLKTSNEASKDLLPKILANYARDQVIAAIGEKRYNKNRSLVESKVVRETSKFLPFVQPAEPVHQPDGTWSMKVEVKLSNSNFRKLIIDAGLLSDAEAPTLMVALISLNDRVQNATQQWWLRDKANSGSVAIDKSANFFFERLQSELLKFGFHVLGPQRAIGTFNPTPFPKFLIEDRSLLADNKTVGEFLEVALVARGDLTFQPTETTLKLEVFLASTGKSVIELNRQFNFAQNQADSVQKKNFEKELTDAFKDLGAQLFDVWTKGALSTRTLNLTLKGSLSPRQLNEAKTRLMGQLRDIKMIRERSIESGKFTYEVEYASDIDDFKNRIKSLDAKDYSFRVLESEFSIADSTTPSFNLEVKLKPTVSR